MCVWVCGCVGVGVGVGVGGWVGGWGNGGVKTLCPTGLAPMSMQPWNKVAHSNMYVASYRLVIHMFL